ncbi:hypothetical protein HYH03_001386 [Edaphochlamys debaryana]|uniref:WSC domain-containing protein n=1 Tax=Edaphochlamys debaryana TaxID=47281 RepID=A0A836C673_9CHLO|nr:hypothetical protein HYH03_001386 [Edaphochlamys debaryana]|eukprot:KAG2500619.1 hypothetical protein HYH03_001386 [Edaphochlamys debaryana]
MDSLRRRLRSPKLVPIVVVLLVSHLRAATSACTTYAGFTAVQDVDHYGDDIAQANTIDEAARLCAASPSCRAFNSNSFYKTNASYSPASGYCFWVKNANCPAFVGFNARANFDHKGDDLLSLGAMASLQHAAQTCSLEAQCRGFNSYAQLKTNVTTAQASLGNCLHTKAAIACPYYPGYRETPNQYRSGDTIATVGPIQEGVQRCTADPTCKGFVFTGTGASAAQPLSSSVLKSNVTGAVGVPAGVVGACLYVKNSPCPASVGFWTSPNTDHWGDALGAPTNATLAIAASKCKANATCKGLNNRSPAPALFSTVRGTYTATNVCLYTKSAACPGFAGFVATPDADHYGDDLLTAANATAAFKECTARAGSCKSFSSAGRLMSGVAGGTHFRQNVCLYVRAACARPAGWCNGTGLLFEATDCDGDGIKDLVCTSLNDGSRGAISLARNCSATSAGTGWPSAPDSYCPAKWEPPGGWIQVGSNPPSLPRSPPPRPSPRPPSPAPAPGDAYQGCYTDNINRGLPYILANNDATLTRSKCARLARERGMTVYGLQIGFQCWAGTDLTRATARGASTACNTPCRGNTSEMCGGDMVTSLFTVRDPPALARTCYNDSSARMLPYWLPAPDSASDSTMTNAKREQMALNAGYFVYGTQYGGYCFAGNNVTLAVSLGTSSACTTACRGNPATEICGGAYANSISLVNGDAYQGCYADNVNRALPYILANSDATLTRSKCARLAREREKTVYGLQIGFQCWAGTNLTRAMARGASAACTTPCQGNAAEMCGGDMTNSLFTVRDPPALVRTCYNDSSARMLPYWLPAPNSASDSSMTNAKCEQMALSAGYFVYGTQYGGYCFAGNNVTLAVSLGTSSACTTICRGNEADICGGAYANSISLVNGHAVLRPS